jgi:hypothetical protein
VGVWFVLVIGFGCGGRIERGGVGETYSMCCGYCDEQDGSLYLREFLDRWNL